MSSGYAANFGYTVSIENAWKIAPKAMAYLLAQAQHGAFDFEDMDEGADPIRTIEDVCHANKYGELANTPEMKEFLRLTLEETGGLELEPNNHSASEEGDIYDEIDGEFFFVGGAYELTPAAKPFKDLIEHSLWVTWG